MSSHNILIPSPPPSLLFRRSSFSSSSLDAIHCCDEFGCSQTEAANSKTIYFALIEAVIMTYKRTLHGHECVLHINISLILFINLFFCKHILFSILACSRYCYPKCCSRETFRLNFTFENNKVLASFQEPVFDYIQ